MSYTMKKGRGNYPGGGNMSKGRNVLHTVPAHPR